MKKEIFRGVGTALVTPFKNDKIDYTSLQKLIERQIECGASALIIGGTTGETATLTDRERYSLYSFCKERIGGRVKLILGTGTNDTRLAVKHTAFASRLGCDGVLVVTPYYNKGTREGIIKHYLKVAYASDAPVMLYNVPTRTGVSLDIPTLCELSRCENIVAIKEASDSQDRLVALSAFGDELHLYAGNDSATYSVLSLGGRGVVSVVSNLYPRETSEITRLFFEGKREESLAMQRRLLPMIESLFLETNPAPVKYAMSSAGLCRNDMRLPMWLPTAACQRRINEEMKRLEEGVGK